MNLEERQNLALTECLILWDYLAENPLVEKETAVSRLYEQGMLSQSAYQFGCPFCEYLRRLHLPYDEECSQCLWPGRKESNKRCDDIGSPYCDWRNAVHFRIPIKAKKAAKEVLALLKRIEI